MSGRFSGLKDLLQTGPEDQDATVQDEPQAPIEVTGPATTPPPESVGPARPWEAAAAPVEPVKALNGRVPRSVRLAFDRQLTDAMDALGTDITVDLAVEALARLVTEQPDVRERWLHQLWALKRR